MKRQKLKQIFLNVNNIDTNIKWVDNVGQILCNVNNVETNIIKRINTGHKNKLIRSQQN